jgi:hypothetical protein
MESDFAQFLQQPFVAPVMGLLGFFTVLLVLVVVLLVYLRRRRSHQRVTPPAARREPAYRVKGESDDMPDLDVLVSHLPAQDASAPSSVPAPAPPARAAAAQSSPTRAARTGTYTVTINDGGTTDAVEVMTVLRDVVEGKLVVQMGDKIYQNINNDTEFKDRFTRLMRELAQVAKPLPTASPPAAEAVQEQPAASTQPEAPAEVATSATVETPENPVVETVEETKPPAPRVYVAPAALTGEMPGDLPKFSLDDLGPIKLTRAQRREAKPVPEINIAGAIEAYLQHKLHFTPIFDGRSIHIYPAPDGGVSIEVDGQFYDSVGDVNDPDVRDFLQGTIQEWQDRH